MGTGTLSFVLALASLSAITIEGFKNPYCSGSRSAIVHLFEWKWNDIARECRDFLGPYGYCAVQISPPSENRVVTNPNRPWYERYQPVSYKLITRSGNEDEFRNMVQTCNDAGVRIYADVVVNHMTGVGGNGHGTGGTYFDADNLQFPGVPFGPNDFNYDNCPSGDKGINDYSNPVEVRNCRLVGLLDLKLGSDYVRTKVAEYLNHLTDLGVAGFRVDAAKHMWPGDIEQTWMKLKNNHFGGRPFVYQEVIEQPSEPIKASEYFHNGRVTNFPFGRELSRVFRKQNPMKYLGTWGTGWGMPDSGNVVNFIDNHDNQRGHGGGSDVLTHWESRPYKLASAFMLAHPYGMPRVMSSFEFNRANNYEGPPHNPDMSIKSVTLNGMICEGGWSCEHRWRQIYNMVAFRNIAGNTNIANWVVGGDYRIAFSRGDRAFIAFNLEDFDWVEDFQTGLSAGTYCDVISGNYENGRCTGKSITVRPDGRAHINVCSNCEDPMVAIHAGAKLNEPERRV